VDPLTPEYDVPIAVRPRIMKVGGCAVAEYAALGQHEDPTPTHGCAARREAAMAAFAIS